MPAYQYRCSDCHESFQVRKSMADIDSETRCPTCGTAHTARVIANVAFFSSTEGVRRPVAGASSCSGCSVVGSGCSSCHPR